MSSFKRQSERVLEQVRAVAWHPRTTELQIYADIMLQQVTLLMQLKEGQTMAVAKRTNAQGLILGFDSAFVASLSDIQLRGLLCHEMQHIRTSDNTRMEAYQAPRDWFNGWSGPQLFNYARDCQINDLLGRLRIELPTGGCTGPNMLGRDVADEEVEALMRELAQKQPPPASKQSLSDDLQAAGELAQTEGDESDEVKIGRQAGTQSNRKAGAAPTGSQQAAWDNFLAECLDTRKSRESWFKSNKRLSGVPGFADRSYCLPHREPLPRKHAVIAIDVSGSMDAQSVELLGSLVKNAPAAYDLTVLCFNTEVYVWEGFRAGEPMPTVGGGTDFGAVERWAAARTRYPDAILVLTDGEAACPAVKRALPWTWLIYGASSADHLEPCGRVERLERIVR